MPAPKGVGPEQGEVDGGQLAGADDVGEQQHGDEGGHDQVEAAERAAGGLGGVQGGDGGGGQHRHA
jgi:hypothetical protein